MHNPLEHYVQQLEHNLTRLPQPRREAELKEVRQHLTALSEAYQEQGLSEEAAVQATLTQFGTPRKVGRGLVWAWRRERLRTWFQTWIGVNERRKVLALGLLLGTGFGLWNLIATQLNPLAEDEPGALLMFYGPMFATWSLAGFFASRRTGRLLDAVKVGAAVACVTFVVFDLAVIVRVNLFLDVLTHRSDWQNLMMRFQASGFESLRVYANYVYVTASPFKILVASLIGTVTGLVGGVFSRFSRVAA